MADGDLVVDASVVVEVLLGTPVAGVVEERLAGRALHAPAHFDSEVLSALGRLWRAGIASERVVAAGLRELASSPIARHALPPLLAGAWRGRNNVRLADALYVELGRLLGATVVTRDTRLAAAVPSVELVSG